MISAKEAYELTKGYTKEDLEKVEKAINEKIIEYAKMGLYKVTLSFARKDIKMIARIVEDLNNLGYSTDEKYGKDGLGVESIVYLTISW